MIDQLPSYSVVVSREDGLWVAVVDGLPAGATDVERFEELDEAVRDLITFLADVEPDHPLPVREQLRARPVAQVAHHLFDVALRLPGRYPGHGLGHLSPPDVSTITMYR